MQRVQESEEAFDPDFLIDPDLSDASSDVELVDEPLSGRRGSGCAASMPLFRRRRAHEDASRKEEAFEHGRAQPQLRVEPGDSSWLSVLSFLMLAILMLWYVS